MISKYHWGYTSTSSPWQGRSPSGQAAADRPRSAAQTATAKRILLLVQPVVAVAGLLHPTAGLTQRPLPVGSCPSMLTSGPPLARPVRQTTAYALSDPLAAIAPCGRSAGEPPCSMFLNNLP